MADERNDQTNSDGYPEIVVNEEDGTVTLKSEQQPEKKPVEPVVPEPEQGKEPEVTPPEEEQPPELNPLDREFKNAGLDKQFGDLPGMIRSVPGLNQAYTQSRQELAEAKRQLWEAQHKAPPVPEPTIDPDAFMENPTKVIDIYIEGKLAAQRTEINNKFDLMEAQKFVESKPDILDLVPAMENELFANPGLNSLSAKEKIQVLYKMAKASQIPAIVKDTANKARPPAPDKALGEAGTKGVGKPKTSGERTREEWEAMPLSEIEKEIGVVDT